MRCISFSQRLLDSPVAKAPPAVVVRFPENLLKCRGSNGRHAGRKTHTAKKFGRFSSIESLLNNCVKIVVMRVCYASFL